jgi:hypothetical protein
MKRWNVIQYQNVLHAGVVCYALITMWRNTMQAGLFLRIHSKTIYIITRTINLNQLPKHFMNEQRLQYVHPYNQNPE